MLKALEMSARLTEVVQLSAGAVLKEKHVHNLSATAEPQQRGTGIFTILRAKETKAQRYEAGR